MFYPHLQKPARQAPNHTPDSARCTSLNASARVSAAAAAAWWRTRAATNFERGPFPDAVYFWIPLPQHSQQPTNEARHAELREDRPNSNASPPLPPNPRCTFPQSFTLTLRFAVSPLYLEQVQLRACLEVTPSSSHSLLLADVRAELRWGMVRPGSPRGAVSRRPGAPPSSIFLHSFSVSSPPPPPSKPSLRPLLSPSISRLSCGVVR